MSKAKTKDEMLSDFISAVNCVADYWSRVENISNKDRCHGVKHSILTIIDGMSGSFPCAIDLVLRPHPDDKQYYIDDGEDFIEDGMVINNDVYLHEVSK